MEQVLIQCSFPLICYLKSNPIGRPKDPRGEERKLAEQVEYIQPA